jgi:uncharacterized delta-60 repeat protein
MKTFTFLTFFLFLLGTAAIAQPFVIDSSFNGTGYNMREWVNGSKMLQQKNGQVIVVGAKGDSITIWRFLATGALDMSFGNNGAGCIYRPAALPSLQIIDIQQHRNGKFTVLVDAANHSLGNPRNADASILIARYNSNGTPDMGFSPTGYIISRPLAGHLYMPKCMAFDTTGTEDRIYIGCTAAETGGYAAPDRWSISKYKMNGVLDSSFNSIGNIQGYGSDINPGTAPLAVIYDMKVMTNGRLLVAGAHRGSDQAWMLFRMMPNGTFDNTFGNNGRIYKPVSFSIPSNALSDGFILPDGTITMTTQRGDPSRSDTAFINIIRYNPDGSLISSFGNNGIREISLTHTMHSYTSDSARRILISWYKPVGTTKQHQQLHFIRLTATGALDTSFGGTGHVISEPVLNDAFHNQAQVTDITYTPDFKGVNLIAFRNTLWATGYSIYRYKFVLPKPSQVATIKTLDASIYPVPASDKLHITTPATERISSVSLYSMTGQMVLTQTGIDKQQHSINTNALAPGQYMISIYGTAGSRLQQTIMIR